MWLSGKLFAVGGYNMTTVRSWEEALSSRRMNKGFSDMGSVGEFFMGKLDLWIGWLLPTVFDSSGLKILI